MKNKEYNINLLKNLVRNYQGLSIQNKYYNKIINDLRKIYLADKYNFTSKDIQEINNLKNKFSNINFKNRYIRDRLIDTNINIEFTKLKENIVVLHKEELYVGVIICKTTKKELFENKFDNEEYRIQISEEQDKVASPENLIVIGLYKPTYNNIVNTTQVVSTVEFKNIYEPGEGCDSCKYRKDCIRKGIVCDDYVNGKAISDYTQWG